MKHKLELSSILLRELHVIVKSSLHGIGISIGWYYLLLFNCRHFLLFEEIFLISDVKITI